jgi:hypothetical protein
MCAPVLDCRDQKGTSMKTIHKLTLSCVVASAALFGAAGSAVAADEWFVLGQKAIRATDPSTAIKSQGDRWDKDIKQVRLSADGADVKITSIVFHWDNRRDDALKDVGVLKSGGQTAPADAPGLKGRLSSVTVHYKILGGKPTATLKVWGLD